MKNQKILQKPMTILTLILFVFVVCIIICFYFKVYPFKKSIIHYSHISNKSEFSSIDQGKIVTSSTGTTIGQNSIPPKKSEENGTIPETGANDDKAPDSTFKKEGKDPFSDILQDTSNILTYISLFFLTVTITLSIVGFWGAKGYAKLKKKVEAVDKNLAAATAIALSTLPELSYSFITPEKYLPCIDKISQSIDSLMIDGEEQLLKYPGGARLLLTSGELDFLKGNVSNGINKWEKIVEHRNTPDDVRTMSTIRLAIGYNQRGSTADNENRLVYLNEMNKEPALYHLVIFFKYLWYDNIIDEYDRAFLENHVKHSKKADFILPEDMPSWFIASLWLNKNQEKNNALELFSSSLNKFISDELKQGNYNLAISWIASLLGLIIKTNKITKFSEIYKKTLNLVYSPQDEYPALIEKTDSRIKLFWLPFDFDTTGTIKKLGKFVNKEKIKAFLKKADQSIRK